MNKICKKCSQKIIVGTDGYCQQCLEKEQKKIIANWSKINNPKNWDS